MTTTIKIVNLKIEYPSSDGEPLTEQGADKLTEYLRSQGVDPDNLS
jgi:hypothetical protein